MNALRPLIGISSPLGSCVEEFPTTLPKLAPYIGAVVGNGGVPVLFPVGLPHAELRAAYERVQGVLIAGGSDVDPQRYGQKPHASAGAPNKLRDEAEILLVRWALEDHKPLLALCRGCQVVNVACGGTLYQDIPSQLPEAGRHQFDSSPGHRSELAHSLILVENSRLAEILGVTEIRTNSFHHQAVKDVGENLCVSTRAPDGIIEGLEAAKKHPFFLAVQSHPEELWHTTERHWAKLFQAFIGSTTRG
jgi:putative glutamine amidotransferase